MGSEIKSSAERAARLWNEERKAVKSGPFVDSYEQLSKNMQTNQGVLEPTRTDHIPRALATPMISYQFRTDSSTSGPVESGQIAAFVPKSDKDNPDSIHLLVAPTATSSQALQTLCRPRTDNQAKEEVPGMRLRLDRNGTLVDLDSLETIEDSETTALLTGMIRALYDNLDRLGRQEASRRELQRRRRNARIARIAAGTLGLVFGVGGGGAAIYTWGVRPAIEAEAHRVEFDTGENDLPGEGVVVQYGTVEAVPGDYFKDIPSRGASDDFLDDPRLVNPNSEGCVIIKDFEPGSRLIAAAPEGNSYLGSTYKVGPYSSDVQVCFSGPEELVYSDKVAIVVEEAAE